MISKNYEWRLPFDIVDGLNAILFESLLPEGSASPFTVITTAPSLWSSYVSSQSAAILDVSKPLVSNEWASEDDIVNNLVADARSSGWPDDCINTNFRYTSPHESIFPDLAICGTDGQPIALVEIGYTQRDGVIETTRRLQRYMEALDLATSFIYAGSNLFRVDRQRESLKEDLP